MNDLSCSHGLPIWEPCGGCLKEVLQASGHNARLRLLLTACARYIAGGAAQWGKKELLERIKEELK